MILFRVRLILKKVSKFVVEKNLGNTSSKRILYNFRCWYIMTHVELTLV